MKLTKKSVLTVVVPTVSTEREDFAAAELVKYLQKIFSGITVCVAKDTKKQPELGS